MSLDEQVLKTAQEFSGISQRTTLLLEALKTHTAREASRQLAALGGTMPDLEHARREDDL